MPIYIYRCECGEEIEVLQHDCNEIVKKCCRCGSLDNMKRVLSPFCVVYKGRGFTKKTRQDITKLEEFGKQ